MVKKNKFSKRKIERVQSDLDLTEKEAIQYLTNIKKKVKPKSQQFKHRFGSKHNKFIFTGDWHIGNENYRQDIVDIMFKYAKKEKPDCIYHAGDITDGMYPNRQDQVYELEDIGFDAQLKHTVDIMDESPIPIFGITGNHDWTHIRNTGANIGDALDKQCKQFNYLGQDEADIDLGHGTNMKIIHPGKGSSYALSYQGQKLIESLEGGKKPNLLLEGHYHKLLHMFYRNIHHIDVGTVCDQTRFFRTKNLQAHKGFWVADVWFKPNNGGIEKLVTELVTFYD